MAEVGVEGNVASITPYLEPIRKSVSVRCTPARAFSVFTTHMARWWPLATHSLSQAAAVSCGIEPFAGGTLYEVRDDGERIEWGRVLVWQPPERLVLAWHPGQPRELAQEVELRFTASGEGTRVDLEHRDWQKLADKAVAARSSYDKGWELVFEGLFANACAELEVE